MTTTDTEALRRLAYAATPGPWPLFSGGEYVGGVGIVIAPDDGGVSPANAEFIAAARTAVPALLDENAALRARIKAVQDVHWPDKALNGHICAEDDHDWPCPTIRALDGTS